MFSRHDPKAVAELDDAWTFGAGWLMRSAKAGQRFRLRLSNIVSKTPANRLLVEKQVIAWRPLTKVLSARLRQMPIFGAFDLRGLLPKEVKQTLAGVLGPRAGIVAGGITSTGKRPIVDLYPGVYPGAGLVGGFLPKRPTPARFLGRLAFAPHYLLMANLGEQLPRSLATIARGMPAEHPVGVVADALVELLESWTGEVALAGSHDLPERRPDQPGDLMPALEQFQTSQRGVLVLGVESGMGEALAKELGEVLSGSLLGRLGIGVETKVHDGVTSLAVGGFHVTVRGADDRILLAFANSDAGSRGLAKSSVQNQKSVPLPALLESAHAPIKLWVSRHTLQMVTVPYRAMESTAPDSMRGAVHWLIDALENRLFAADSLLSARWTRKHGLHLRWQF